MPPGPGHGVSAAQSAPTERRAVPRVRPIVPLEARVQTTQPARILDISSRGAQVELPYGLLPMGLCDLRIEFPEGEFAAFATVRRCQASGFGRDERDQPVVVYRAGLEFVEVDPECLAWLSSNVLFHAEA